jgi:hypothetical protein
MTDNNSAAVMTMMSGGVGSAMILSIGMATIYVLAKKKPTENPSDALLDSPSSSQTTKKPIKKVSNVYRGPFPKAAWKSWDKLLLVGQTLKKTPYNINECKKQCHADKRCTHFEGNIDDSGQKVCVLKSLMMPYECASLKERCSDGFSGTVDFLYAHPERIVATKGYAQKMYDATKAKICNWKCRLKKIALIIVMAVVTAVATIASFFTGGMTLAGAIAFNAVLTGVDVGVSMGVMKSLQKDQRKREETLAIGDPFDSSQFVGISGYTKPKFSCPAQDARCSRTLRMVDAKTDMDLNVPSLKDAISGGYSDFCKWYKSANQADKDSYWQIMARNQEVLQAYQKLPCKLQCADKDLQYNKEDLSYVSGKTWIKFK